MQNTYDIQNTKHTQTRKKCKCKYTHTPGVPTACPPPKTSSKSKTEVPVPAGYILYLAIYLYLRVYISAYVYCIQSIGWCKIMIYDIIQYTIHNNIKTHSNLLLGAINRDKTNSRQRQRREGGEGADLAVRRGSQCNWRTSNLN